MSAAKFATGEGLRSIDRKKPLIRRAARATFSHKGRREEDPLIPLRGIDDVFQRAAGLEAFDLARDIF
jgi:hypothetical protein